MNPIATAVENAGHRLAEAPDGRLGEYLNIALREFLAWPFVVAGGRVIDRHGGSAGPFSSLVYVVSQEIDNQDPIPADSVGAVIDTCEVANVEALRSVFGRMTRLKRLSKTPSIRGHGPITNVTYGVMLARSSAVPLDELAEELQRLNAQTPAREWLDLLVVSNVGTVSYSTQFPGMEPGLFLPPGDGALEAYTPPMYVSMVIKGAGIHAFSQMTALLAAHLNFFSPGAKLPNFSHILEPVPREGLVVCSYQYNLGGEIKPLPPPTNADFLPSIPTRIEDKKGALRATIDFLPWQDGGAVVLKGELPLAPLLMFLGPPAKKAGVVHPAPNLQVSYVLPISRGNFDEMVTRLRNQSNFVIKRPEPSWTIRKIADEGTTSPFMARLYLGVTRLRDVVYTTASDRDRFDAKYEVVMSALLTARSSVKEVETLWAPHVQRITSGAAASVQGQTLQIGENIDRELRKEVETFLNSAVRALKLGMQDLAKELGVDIGFMFKQQKAFDGGIAALQLTDVALAEYLRETRTWSEPLVIARNAIEHVGWTLPPVQYEPRGGQVIVVEPEVSGTPFTRFLDFNMERICCLVEEFTTHALEKRMSAQFAITEIPLPARPRDLPLRFRNTLRVGGMPRWEIKFHRARFEETYYSG